ncbi:MAG: LPS export ABC transporter periplasmic protein LptC, partial [Acidobacteriota bacterium]
ERHARPARRTRARRPFGLLRAVLFLVGLLLVGGVAVLIAAYQFGSSGRQQAEAPATAATTVAEEGEVLRAEGFDLTQTSGGRPVFHISAARVRQDRDQNAFLEDVDLRIFRLDGSVYDVTSDEAVFNEGTRRAELAGNVVLRDGTGLELRARALDIGANGRLLVSRGQVEFLFPPNLEGRASMLRVDLEQEVYVMNDGVHIHSTESAPSSLRLDAERVTYEEAEGIARAVGDVRVRREEDWMASENLTVFFKAGTQDIDFLRARWEVEGEIGAREESPTRTRFEGDDLTIRFDEQENPQPRKIELETMLDGGRPSRLTVDDGTSTRVIDGMSIHGFVDRGVLRLVEGSGSPLEITEATSGAATRRIRAAQLEARFDEVGEPMSMLLDGDVEVGDGEVLLTGGEQARLDWGRGQVIVDGPEVRLLHEQADIVAPRFVYTQNKGLVRAEQGVRAVLSDQSAGALAETPIGRPGDGPINVESTNAVWTLTPQTFAFRGDVRAWRGRNLLFADQLRGDETSGTVAASGGIRTILFPTDSGLTGADRQPVEVTAARLTYSRREGDVIYDQNVVLIQGERRMTCEALTVSLDTEGLAERMLCNRDVVLEDPLNASRVEGERAVYDVGVDRIEIFGDTVKLTKGEGNQVTGKYLVYDVTNGKARMQRRPPSAAEAAEQATGSPTP